jgi:hypothetical protein
MTGDLPPGKYSAALIGAWWPQPSSALRAGAQSWSLQQQQQEEYAQGLRTQWTQLASVNKGHTADDLVSRFQQGEKYHLDLAEKYQAKAAAMEKGADAIDSLREGLKGIAEDYNQRIANVESSKEPMAVKAAEIEKLIVEANGFSAHKSGDAVAALMEATQKILTAEGTTMSPQEFMSTQGLSADNASNPPMATAGPPGPGGGVHGGSGGASVNSPGPPGTGGGQHQGQIPAAYGSPGPPGPGGGIHGGDLSGTPISAPIASPGVAGHTPSVPGVGSPLTGGGLSPAAALGGASPNQLGNSFAQGMMTGQPAAAGAQKLSEGLMNATGATSAPPPQAPLVPPVSAPAITGGAESVAGDHGSGAAASAGSTAPVASTGGGSVPIAAPVAPGPVSAPMTSVAAPAGPLPAYGSDLRPPVVAAPSVSAPTAPVSGAPVAPSSSTSPSAGSPMMSTVQRGSPGQAGTTPAVPAGSAALSATSGALAGDVSSRTAEQQRLQRLVEAVARQAPELPWAVGLRDDGTTLLVCGVGCGWIPPNVKIPVGVNRLLEPALRRPDTTAVDLLGSVTAAAVHKPHGFIANPGPDEPALTGDRVARTGPEVEELRPALVEAVRRRDGLPRIAQTLALATTRGTGVTDNEIDLLLDAERSSCQKVLDDPHDVSRVADWMLLAAIDALIQGHEWLAHYHVAWYEAISAKLR